MKTNKKEDDKVNAETTEDRDIREIKILTEKKQQYEPRWYMSSAFWEGVHFFSGEKDKTGAFKRVKLPKGKVLREIPKAKKLIKNIRTLLLKPNFTPVVYPDRSSTVDINNSEDKDKILDEATKQGKIIRHKMVEEMKFKRHLKKLIRYAAMYSVGYIQIFNDDGKLSFGVYDPFDISVNPVISNINEHPVVIKHFYKSKRELEESEIYDQDKLTKALEGESGGKYSKNQYKNDLMVNRYGTAPDDTYIVDEVYRVEKEEDGTEKVSIRSYIGEVQIRKEEEIETELTKIPIAMFCWEDEAYTTSLLEELIPLNKAYDKFVTKLEEKVNKLGTGRMLIQKGEDTKVITTKDGEILRYKRTKPDIMKEADISGAYVEVLNTLNQDMNEQGVSAATGNIPSGVKAWHAIEALKEADFDSIGTQQDNLIECIVDITEKVAEAMAQTTEIKEVQVSNGNDIENTETLKYTGQAGKDTLTTGGQDINSDVIIIDPNRYIKVEVESAMSYSQVAEKDMAMELAKEQLIPVEVLLDVLKLGNTADIIEKMNEIKTKGMSLIDAPDFQMLPRDLQKAIVLYLDSGGAITDPGIKEIPANDSSGGIQPQPTPMQNK